MTGTEVKGCLYLMKQLWQNYQVPQDEVKMSAVIHTWMQFFGTVPEREVTKTILEISAEGGEFAPQIGQIYARLKTQRLEAKKEPEEPYCNFVAYAAVVGAEPPEEKIGPEGWWAWYARTRAALCDPT